MAVEIERKFLVNLERWQHVEKGTGIFYRQAYIAKNNKAIIRVRMSDSNAFITIKSSSLQLSRSEFEYAIPIADAQQMMSEMGGSEVIKTRFKISFSGKVWEVDEFAGDNTGLIIAEIELASAGEALEYPDWITAEVTGEERYYNSSLAEKAFRYWVSE